MPEPLNEHRAKLKIKTRIIFASWSGLGRIEAAALLGLGRNTLTRKIQELGLEQGETV